MKKSVYTISRMLLSFLLCTGVALTSCVDDPLEKEEDTLQNENPGDKNEGDAEGDNENEGGEGSEDEGGENPGDNDGEGGNESENEFTKSILTYRLENVTELSATFTGHLDIPSSDLYFSKVTLYYSDAEAFNVNAAESVSIIQFDADQNFAITLTGLKNGTRYNYCLVAEVKSEKTYSDVKEFTTVSLVAPALNEAAEITVVSAVVSGKVVFPSVTADDLEYGFQYCKSEGFSSDVVSRKITGMDQDGSFSMEISSLIPAQTYYYRSYVKMDGTTVYGEAKDFTTVSLVAPALNEAAEITEVSAVISGKVAFPSVTADVLEYGFQYCKSEGFSSDVVSKKIIDMDQDGSFSMEISSLIPVQTYYYRSYVKMGGTTVYGEAKEFTTKYHPYLVEADLSMSSAKNLSSSSPANCYIISEAGLYKFKTVKGNSTTSVGNVASAAILWETFGTSTSPEFCDLISGFCYKDSYIAFQTADTFKEGNAVIAAKDSDGNILWSWHIWFTDQPQAHVYNNNAGTMMDRNLGATSATPGDVGALGLLYQWGRKDPFLGSSSISSSTLAKSTITWPSAVETSSSVGTVDYVTSNPTTFVTGSSSSNYDWHYSSRDNNLWTTSDKSKSVYDPCPSGWRVPDGGYNGIWSKAGFAATTYDSTNAGISFSISSPSKTWYPASGYLNCHAGGMNNVGNGGTYWSASAISNVAYYLDFINDGSVYSLYCDFRAYGSSVRCLQE